MQDKGRDAQALEDAVRRVQQLEDELERVRLEFGNFRNAEQTAQDRFRHFVEKTPAGICITNAQGVFEYVNPAYCEIYRFRDDELIGRHFTIVVPEEYRQQLNDMHERFIREEHVEVRGEWTVLRKDGKPLTILADAALLIQPDGSRQKATFVQDITARKQVEELRERVERITRHDLKTPLNAVINLPELLLAEENLTEEQREMVAMVRDAGYRMLETINLSHDLFKMETRCYELQPRPLDLQPIVRRVLRELSPIARSRTLHVEEHYDAGPQSGACIAQGEELLCYSMLANLLKNAMEASPSGGTVVLQTSCEQRPDGGQLARIDIRNKGVVPNEMRHCFFEKYTTHGKREGTGLGTYSARLIAETQGGHIDMHADDEADSTTVTVWLPA